MNALWAVRRAAEVWGDTVAVIDSSRTPEWRLKARAVKRVRTFGDAVICRVTIGTVQPVDYSVTSSLGKYDGLGFTPWDSNPGTHRSNLTSVTFASDMSTYSVLRLDYLLYLCTAVTSVAGFGNLSSVTSMRFTFSSIGATSLDFRGFDSSSLTDLYYCFGGASSLTTIYADSTWTLPSNGISGSQCFYNCRSLIGGNGTTWSSSNVSYTYFRIDTVSAPGYLTAAT